MSTHSNMDQHIKEQAREWHVIMHSGNLPQEMRQKFEAWLHADRAHKQAYHAFEQLYRDLDFALPRAGINVDELLGRQQSPFMAACSGWAEKLKAWPVPAVGTLAAGFVAVALVFGGLHLRDLYWGPQSHEAPLPPSTTYATAVAEISEVTLEDGTIITLGAKSSFDAVFTPGSRRVTLVRGQAFFDVAKDPARPFYVTVQDTLVRVVGTKFDVKSIRGEVRVSVLEGVVEVMKPGKIPASFTDTALMNTPKHTLTAGEQVTAQMRKALPQVEKVGPTEAGAWRSGRRSYENASLIEIISDLNRHHKRQINIASQDIAGLRTTITFNTADVAAVLEMVAAIHPVEVIDGQRDQILLRRKHTRN
ncbi:MAG: FecR domain-containing protein [Kordiimonadaceae bacterium]|nr:FecR domain-containing protein [Kordiimonadaceae bacterium]